MRQKPGTGFLLSQVCLQDADGGKSINMGGQVWKSLVPPKARQSGENGCYWTGMFRPKAITDVEGTVKVENRLGQEDFLSCL